MNSNRGQYSFTPMYNMKNKRGEKKKEAGQEGAPSVAPRRHMALSVVLSVGLPVLFLVALLVPNNTLRWVFLAVTGASVLAMWVLRAFVRSARNTLTVIYAALAVVIGLALFINRQTPESRNIPSSLNQASLFSNPDAGSVNAMLNELSATDAPQADPTPAPEPEAYTRLKGFLAAWGQNAVSEMKEYCLPSWVNEQQSAETVLFQMLSRSRPTSYVDALEDITGSDGDNSRILTMKVIFDESGNSVVKRMRVIMKKINDVWYVDPNSLDGVVVDEAAEAAAAANQNLPHSTITPAPAATNEADVLYVYYNEKGGKYYHLDSRCSRVDSSYWPLTGKIPFDLINSQDYKKLLPCDWCAAPTRPPI